MMVDYAKISKMIEYQKKGIWPLDKLPKEHKQSLKQKLSDILRIVISKGPVKSTHFHNVVNLPTECFRYGTRAWEYPWVLAVLKENVKPNLKVLDCGCGTNGFPLVLNRFGYKAIGLDYFVSDEPKNVGYGLTETYIKKNGDKIKFVNGGMEAIPLDDNTIDAITCISVMEHVVIAHKENPDFHLTCLKEMYRVLKPGGLLICTYDTILDRNVVFANKYGWGKEGWYYKDDIDYLFGLGMRQLNENAIPKREEIISDGDAFFIPPDFYFAYGYGSGFSDFGKYHRLTSLGFVLVKHRN